MASSWKVHESVENLDIRDQQEILMMVERYERLYLDSNALIDASIAACACEGSLDNLSSIEPS